VFETLGVAGIAISMLAYMPQVVHLAREHCSAGVSRRAWAMWLVSSLLVGTLAVQRGDLVFILLQISSLTSAAVILTLAQRYRGMVCEVHALRPQPRQPDRLRALRGEERRTGYDKACTLMLCDNS
jgi:lipid-A-disaccharide synthase-like uncharacterized protein